MLALSWRSHLFQIMHVKRYTKHSKVTTQPFFQLKGSKQLLTFYRPSFSNPGQLLITIHKLQAFNTQKRGHTLAGFSVAPGSVARECTKVLLQVIDFFSQTRIKEIFEYKRAVHVLVASYQQETTSGILLFTDHLASAQAALLAEARCLRKFTVVKKKSAETETRFTEGKNY